jgi:hypothetical protein
LVFTREDLRKDIPYLLEGILENIFGIYLLDGPLFKIIDYLHWGKYGIQYSVFTGWDIRYNIVYVLEGKLRNIFDVYWWGQ